MEVNPQPPLSLAPWPRISCQSWAADTQLCSNSHTAWTQHTNVCLSVYMCIFFACVCVCVWVYKSPNIHTWLSVFACLDVTGFFMCCQIQSVSPSSFIETNLSWNKKLTLWDPKATKCTQHWPQQPLTESHGHKHTDPYLPVLSTGCNGGTGG